MKERSHINKSNKNTGKLNLTEKILICTGILVLIAGGGFGVRAAVDGFSDGSTEESAEEEISEDVTVTSVENGICYMSDGTLRTESGEQVVKISSSMYGDSYYISEDGRLLTLDKTGVYDESTGLICYEGAGQDGADLYKTPDGGVLIETEDSRYILYDDGTRKTLDGGVIGEDGSITYDSDDESGNASEENSIEAESEEPDEDDDYDEESDEDAVDEGTDADAEESVLLPDDIIEDTESETEYDSVEDLVEITSVESWDEDEYPKHLSVILGTAADDLNLPEFAICSAVVVREYLLNDEIVDSASGESDTLYLPVVWECDDYDPGTEGTYTFRPEYDRDAVDYSLEIADGVWDDLSSRTVEVVDTLDIETSEEEPELLGTSELSVQYTIYKEDDTSFTASMSGANDISIGLIKSVKATVSGGTAPYTYKWYVDGEEKSADGSMLNNPIDFDEDYTSDNSETHEITCIIMDSDEGSIENKFKVTVHQPFTFNLKYDITDGGSGTYSDGSVLEIHDGTTVDMTASTTTSGRYISCSWSLDGTNVGSGTDNYKKAYSYSLTGTNSHTLKCKMTDEYGHCLTRNISINVVPAVSLDISADVEDDTGYYDTASKTLHVTTSSTFKISAYYYGGTGAACQWSSSDGNLPTDTSRIKNSDGLSVLSVPRIPAGTYIVTAAISDTAQKPNNYASDSITVIVSEDLTAVPSVSPSIGDISYSSSDDCYSVEVAEGMEISIESTVKGGYGSHYCIWDSDDISSIDGKHTESVSWTPDSTGTYTVVFIACDDDVNTAYYTLELTVVSGLQVNIEVPSLTQTSDDQYGIKPNTKFNLAADVNRTTDDLVYSWSVSNLSGGDGITIPSSDVHKSKVSLNSGNNTGKKFRFTLKVTDNTLGQTVTDSIILYVNNTSLSIDALLNDTGNLIQVYEGQTVVLNAIYFGSGTETVTWHSGINSVNGRTGMSCTFTAKASDDGKTIYVTDTAGDKSGELTVKIISTDLKLEASPSKVEFCVTQGFTKSVTKELKYTLSHTASSSGLNAVMTASENSLGGYISETNNSIALDKNAASASVTDTLKLKADQNISIGDYYSYYISAKYGFENSSDNAWSTFKVPVYLKVMEPTRISTPTDNMYQYAKVNPIEDGDSVTLKPTVTEYEKAVSDKSSLGGDSVTYQWYEISSYYPGDIAEVEEINSWKELTGETGKTLTVTPEGSASGLKYHAYMLVATDRYGTVTCSDDPMVVCVSQMKYTMTVEKVDTESEGEDNTLDFGSAIAGYNAAYISNSPQKIRVTNTGNKTIENVTIKELDTKTGLIGSAFKVSGFTSGTSLEAGRSLILTISPVGGLSAGAHESSLTLQGKDSAGTSYTADPVMSLEFIVSKVSGKLVITGDTIKNNNEIDFGNLTEGYDTLPEAQYITLTNNGNASFDIKAPTSEYFDIWYKASDIDISADPTEYLPMADLSLEPDAYDGVYNLFHNNLTLKILPKTGLKADGDSEKEISETVKFEYGTAGRYSNVVLKVNIEPQLSGSVLEWDDDENVELDADISGGSKPYTYGWYDMPKPDTGEDTRTTLGNEESLVLPADVTGTYYLDVTDANGAFLEIKYIVDSYKLLITVGDGSSMIGEFGTTVAGYKEAPSEVSIKLTNEGTATLTNIVYSSIDDFEITGLEITDDLAPGKSITLKAAPKLNLAVGNYDEKFTLQADQTGQSEEIELKFTVIPGDETLSVSPEKLTFATTSEGYSKLPDAQKVTVTNKGNKSAVIKMPNPKSYKITGFSSDKTLEMGDSFSFYVQPIKGLKAGTQSEFISLQTASGVTGFTAEMKVNDAPKVTISGATSTDQGVAATLTANVTGGTEPYTYKWSTGGTGSTESVSPDSATQVTVTVTDAAGVTAKASFNIAVAGQLTVTVSGPSRVNSGASATLTAAASGGTSPYTYSWSTGLSGTSLTVTPTETATYTVTATDKLGSKASASITVTVQNLEVKEKEANVHALTGNNTSISLGSAVAGYKASSYSRQFTITNNGNTTEVIKAPKSTAFEISGIDGEVKLAAGESITVTITPKANMISGSYNEVLSFTANSGAKIDVAADFEVEASPAEVDLNREQTYVDKNYDYGTGTVNYQIQCDTESPIVGVGDTSSTATAVLSEDELRQLKAGTDCTIRITTQALNGAVSTGDKTLIQNALNEYRINNPDIIVGMYMDITVEKQIGNGEWSLITETDKPVNLVVDIPEELRQAGTDYFLLRLHDQEVATVAEWKTGEEEVDFNTTKCSAYAICYVPDASYAALHGQGIHMNDSGEFVDADGNPMDRSGKSFDSDGNIVDSNGNVYDADGNLIDTSSKTPVWVIIAVSILGLAAVGGLIWLIFARAKNDD